MIARCFLAGWMVCSVEAFASTPSWTEAELRQIDIEVKQASVQPNVPALDAALVMVAARGYKVAFQQNATIPQAARQVLLTRMPKHPQVDTGMWAKALMRRFYQDVSDRAVELSRFETRRHVRQWLQARSKEFGQAAQILASQVRTPVAGFEGVVGLPPKVGGDEPVEVGARAELTADGLVVERLPRAKLIDGKIAPKVPRTKRGSIREVYAALKQFQTTAQMLGQYDSEWYKKKGHLQVLLPSAASASILNELVRASVEAKMRVIHLVTLGEDNRPRELKLRLQGRKKRFVQCTDQQTLIQCARKLAHARLNGAIYYRL